MARCAVKLSSKFLGISEHGPNSKCDPPVLQYAPITQEESDRFTFLILCYTIVATYGNPDRPGTI